MENINQKIETVSIGSLKEHPANARRGDMDLIRESVKENGFFGVVVAQKSTGHVLAGNHRLRAAIAEGATSIPVCWVDVDDVKAKKILLSDNKTSDAGSYDDEQLLALVSELHSIDDLTGSGFDEADFLALAASVGETENEKSQEGEKKEDLPKPKELPFSAVVDKGDMRKALLRVADCTFDACVTDPPYEIGFDMKKSWDSTGVAYDVETWLQVFRTLKEGAFLCAFGAARTMHGITTAIEKAGFEVRDQFNWLYFSGFPKSLNIEKEFMDRNDAENAAKWAGWGTALKPAFEPCVIARKPFTGTVAENVLKNGTGGLNIDACRHAVGDNAWVGPNGEIEDVESFGGGLESFGTQGGHECKARPLGRWPANIFYCPKPSRKEKETGCASLPVSTGADAIGRDEGSAGLGNPRAGAGRTSSEIRNVHPTVKPIQLMRHLVRLTTPQGAKVLDPFVGSGTTGIAAMLEGRSFHGIEMDDDHHNIAMARIGAWEDFKPLFDDDNGGK